MGSHYCYKVKQCIKIERQLRRKYILVVGLLLVSTLILLSYSENDISDIHIAPTKFGVSVDIIKYLINTTNCKIPDMNPWNEDVLPFVKQEKYEECSNKPLLTYIQRTDEAVKLKINQSVINLYSNLAVRCCYSKILRKGGDELISHTNCKEFEEETVITHHHIRVICKNIFHIVYVNVHSAFIYNASKSNQMEHNNITKPLKIFMLGIDSISRLNLQRTMPKTFKYLEDNYIDIRGYNKIGENTFPNLVAILAGRSVATLGDYCRLNQTFDNCNVMWKSFKENGFVTAYGEDEPSVSTFNFYKTGFHRAPTDYFLRPYFISAYNLYQKERYNMVVCSGPENTAERMFNAAKDFETSLTSFPTFAMFWMNSFSHDNVNLPSSMDSRIESFLSDSDISNSWNESIVIVFSDHGFRFGDLRYTYTGYMEERLPFLYFRVPDAFRKSYPDLFDNINVNAKNRLVTPFDFHMTLKHLLKLYNDTWNVEQAIGCPTAQSLFYEIPENRSCSDACIPKKWCTCAGYSYFSTKESVALSVAHFAVEKLNEIIQTYPDEADLCARYILRTIVAAGRSQDIQDSKDINVYLILFETFPFAMFEANVQVDTVTQKYELLGDVSRLNRYSSYSSCIIKNGNLKKYCFCDGWFTSIKSGLCYWLGC